MLNVRETKCTARTLKVFSMYVHKKMSMNEISKELGSSRVTVKKDLERMATVNPQIKQQIEERMKLQNEFSPKATKREYVAKPVMVSFEAELLEKVDEHWKELGTNGRSEYLMNLIKKDLEGSNDEVMTNHNKAWRRSEESKLVERVNEYLKTDDWDQAFERVANDLGRTTRGCKDRWNLLNGKRKRRLVKPEIQIGDYAQLYNNFKSVSGELENVIGNLMGENERLKRRVSELEAIEAKFKEFGQFFNKL